MSNDLMMLIGNDHILLARLRARVNDFDFGVQKSECCGIEQDVVLNSDIIDKLITLIVRTLKEPT